MHLEAALFERVPQARFDLQACDSDLCGVARRSFEVVVRPGLGRAQGGVGVREQLFRRVAVLGKVATPALAVTRRSWP